MQKDGRFAYQVQGLYVEGKRNVRIMLTLLRRVRGEHVGLMRLTRWSQGHLEGLRCTTDPASLPCG